VFHILLAALQQKVLGCADEDSAYLSKRMLRVGTSDDARVSTVETHPKGEITELLSPGRHLLDGPVLSACPKSYQKVQRKPTGDPVVRKGARYARAWLTWATGPGPEAGASCRCFNCGIGIFFLHLTKQDEQANIICA